MNFIEILAKHNYPDKFDFDFDELLETLPFKRYTQRKNAITGLKSQCIEGVDFIEVKVNNQKKLGVIYEYKLTASAVRKLFFNQNPQMISPFEKLINEKNLEISRLEAEVELLQKQLDERYVQVPKVEKIPLVFLLRKHGREAVKRYLSGTLEGMTANQMFTLRQSWNAIANYCNEHEELRKPLLTVLSFFINPYILQTTLKDYFESYLPKTNQEDLEMKRFKWRMNKRAQRKKQKEQELMRG